jgi:hypothetical protein
MTIYYICYKTRIFTDAIEPGSEEALALEVYNLNHILGHYRPKETITACSEHSHITLYIDFKKTILARIELNDESLELWKVMIVPLLLAISRLEIAELLVEIDQLVSKCTEPVQTIAQQNQHLADVKTTANPYMDQAARQYVDDLKRELINKTLTMFKFKYPMYQGNFDEEVN